MSGGEPTKRRRKKTRREPIAAQSALSPEERQSLRDFVRFALGDGDLTAWEENFLNGMKQRLYRQAVWLTGKQQVVLQQLKDKLRYDRRHDPLPPIDPDGVEAAVDPDAERVVRDWLEDDQLFDLLEEA